MSDLDTFARGYWYAAVASSLVTGGPVAAKVLDRRLAVFRDTDGRAHAVHDRCVHRGTELHLGEVVAGALACRYHGWRFAGDGRCVHIPSLAAGQSIAKGVGVRGFPCQEVDGYVWTWMGDEPPAEGPRPIDRFDDFNWTQGALDLDCAALSAIENNLDWCHPVFAHPFTHGMFFMNQAMGFQDQTVEMRLMSNGLTCFVPPTDSLEARPNPAVSLTYDLPDRVTVAFNLGPQGPTRIVMHMVATGAGTCRQEWLASTGAADPALGPRVEWTDAPNPIFEQDRAILESIQRAMVDEGQDVERSVEADAATLTARRIHALACAGHWERDRAGLAQRRLIRLRS